MWQDVVGRALDLDSAYKQVSVSCDTLWGAVLAMEDPHGGKQLFRSNVLPFGASAAVCGFNRLSRALYTIGVSLFVLLGRTIMMTAPSPTSTAMVTQLTRQPRGWWSYLAGPNPRNRQSASL